MIAEKEKTKEENMSDRDKDTKNASLNAYVCSVITFRMLELD